jgi:hypothetical protein
VTRIHTRFINANNLPEHAVQTIRENNGIHTLVDYQAVILVVDRPGYMGMQELLAPDGKIFSF